MRNIRKIMRNIWKIKRNIREIKEYQETQEIYQVNQEISRNIRKLNEYQRNHGHENISKSKKLKIRIIKNQKITKPEPSSWELKIPMYVKFRPMRQPLIFEFSST